MSNNSYETYSGLVYIQNILSKIFTPYIIIVTLIGITGNALTIIMLSKRSLTKNFNNCTLIALAVTDLLFNLSLLSHCLFTLSGYSSNDFCVLLAFVSHLAELLSASFTAHFTIQRFFAVKFPLSVFMEKNIHILHYIIVSLVILFGISFCFALIKANSYESCEEELQLKWFISDAILSFVTPFTIIATLNLLIIFHLRKTSRKNQRLSFSNKQTKKEFLRLNSKPKSSLSYDSNSHSRSSVHTIGSNIKTSLYRFPSHTESNDNHLSVDIRARRTASIRSTTRSHAQSHRVTRMLIIVSTCFLLLNAPSHICSISVKIYSLRNGQLTSNSRYINANIIEYSNETMSTIIENSDLTSTTIPYREASTKMNANYYYILYITIITCQHISYLSYSINFFLYSFCGMKFRRELKRFLPKCGNYQQRLQKSPILYGSHIL
ncbi:unnamed protein product [Adineta steineri]|uniref:G-protein coupled receptors family 1 profile domain-containing protein n=1 Tax=Adineta steineri TaxID=433720 RepID=A0A814HI36_9BILA|nr:unnamed protein product [Adineta steineri]